MTPFPRARQPMRAALVLASLVLAATAVLADDGAVRRCRALTDAAQRLACYDAMPLGAAASGGASSGASTPLPRADNRETPAEFGITAPAAREPLAAIDSRIDGPFEGWTAKSTITLSNGQVWQIADGSRATLNLSSPTVTVRRGALGAFYLDITGTNKSPRVKRLQ